MIVCVCKAVSERDIRRAVAGGCDSVEEIARCTGATTGCGTCTRKVRCALAEHEGESAKQRFLLPLAAGVA